MACTEIRAARNQRNCGNLEALNEFGLEVASLAGKPVHLTFHLGLQTSFKRTASLPSDAAFLPTAI